MFQTTTKSYTLNFHHVDSQNQLRLTTLFKMMQDTAWTHANDNKMGLDLLAQNRFWALSRLLLEMKTYPKWEETIHIKTWAKHADGLFAYRDFLILDDQKNTIGACSSIWLLVDLERRRPVRLGPLLEQMPILKEDALQKEVGKLPKIEGGTIAEHFKIRPSDIDMNQHVNNVQYIQWIMDSIPESISQDKQLETIHIQFMAECSLGEEVSVYIEKRQSNNSTNLRNYGRRKGDQKEVFRSFCSWK